MPQHGHRGRRFNHDEPTACGGGDTEEPAAPAVTGQRHRSRGRRQLHAKPLSRPQACTRPQATTERPCAHSAAHPSSLSAETAQPTGRTDALGTDPERPAGDHAPWRWPVQRGGQGLGPRTTHSARQRPCSQGGHAVSLTRLPQPRDAAPSTGPLPPQQQVTEDRAG